MAEEPNEVDMSAPHRAHEAVSAGGYDAKAARSPMTDDVRRLLRVNAKLEDIFAGADFFVMGAEVTIGSPDGYVLGSVWWDGESEVWRIDTARHGQAT